jgi:hypothetical protein
VTINCPNCGKTHPVPPNSAGTVIRCGCGTAVPVTASPSSGPPPLPSRRTPGPAAEPGPARATFASATLGKWVSLAVGTLLIVRSFDEPPALRLAPIGYAIFAALVAVVCAIDERRG